MNDQPTINPIHTPCKNCVFAIYDNITQTDCALKYIDLYKRNKIEILEAYDNNKEFYIINNKKCIGYREPKFFNNKNMGNSSLDEKIAYYNQHNRLDYSVVVDLKNLSQKELDNIFNQLSSSYVQPKKVIIIRYIDQKNSNDFQYSNIESIINKYQINYTWRLQTILDNTLTMDDVLRGVIHNNIQQRFVLYISSFSENVGKITNIANDTIHKELGQFSVLSDNQHSAIIFSTAVYRFAKFNNEDLLKDTNTYTMI